MFVNVAFATSSTLEEHDRINSTQTLTQPSAEEIAASNEKSKDAEALVSTIKKYKLKKVSKKELEQAVNNFSSKYKYNLTADKIPNLEPNTADAKSITAMTASDSQSLNFTCYRQLTDWYCGPASAYIVLKGMGKTSYNGRTLSQSELATDLGAQTQGAGWTGTWASTMSNWSGKTYLTANAPSASTILNHAYIDTICSMGSIYDTYMSGTNQLPGYTANSGPRFHYVAGDGYDNYNCYVHYEDPHNTNNSAFGPHWVGCGVMAACTSSSSNPRGMVW